ncbi:AAA family ATPase [Donghicola eburneus]|uniref:Putative EA59 gene protein, phage lambda n=1 Tax=Donghicola eburneus TaxID=393278 RepID=A0A1M4MZY8_9RHOB|nr:AAA family ATPase [Donghicola eburneus]SCM68129.1 putative EA59 gene protein, phage lambda [Donghicola eburneus]
MLIQETSRDGSDAKEGVTVRLEKDGWDDYGFKTLYRMSVWADGIWKSVGKVRIASPSVTERTYIGSDPVFRLPEDYFSLGVDENYYETLSELGNDLRADVLTRLNDVAFSNVSYESLMAHRVFKVSLMRGKDDEDFDTLRRYALGKNTRSNFELRYSYSSAAEPTSDMTFLVQPHSLPSTNIHAIIGSNGVGKSTLLRDIIKNAIGSADTLGSVNVVGEDGEPRDITRLIFVSYSAFDDHSISKTISDLKMSLDVKYIGLTVADGTLEGEVGDEDLIDEEFSEEIAAEGIRSDQSLLSELSQDFIKTMYACSQGYRWSRWRKAVETLQIDPVFRGIDIDSFYVVNSSDAAAVGERFQALSSGHAISLLIVSKLVMHMRERCVVLIDEPESHLHPPLLAALINALSNVVTDRNGIAILTTHSPVVLQEIPSNCVWVMARGGNQIRISRPRIETYGENLSEITREVFRLEVHESGFHRTLMELIDQGYSYDKICEIIPRMGAEARALVMTLAD